MQVIGEHQGLKDPKEIKEKEDHVDQEVVFFFFLLATINSFK